MATLTADFSHLNGDTGGGVNDHTVTICSAGTNVKPEIPDYAILNNVTLSFAMRDDKWISTGDCYVYAGSSQWSGKLSIKYDYSTFTVDKNNLSSILSFFNSGAQNVGVCNGNVYLQCHADLSRNFYWKDIKVVFDYTVQTFTLTVNAGTGGTVTGGGTYNNQATATLTATPNTGYEFVKWSDGITSATRTVTVTGNATYTATFEKLKYTVNFKNADGSAVSSKTLEHGATLGTLPTVSRSGYTFAGWMPCEPAKKTDGSVLDSYKYNGDNAYPLDKKYKYTDKLSVHIEAYMSNWEDIASLKAQIISCTEGGGWGLGYQANSSGHGTELYAGGYKGIDLELGTAGKFSNNTWYSFDIVFSNGTFEAYVNGTKKGTQTTANTAISYNSENTIFVGAEAAKSATTPGGNYFKGHISNVFIANKGTRLVAATTSTVVEGNVDYYPVWRLNPTYTITVVSSNEKTGTVTGGGTYECGESVTLTAVPNDGYRFKQWSDGVTSATRTVTVTGAATYTAVFELIPPEIKLVQMIYLDKQISATNKVPCGEGFIISVELS